MQSMQPFVQQTDHFDGQQPDRNQPPHPFQLLQQLFNPGNAQHGDMVFSQAGFDQVMTQLMENNGGGNAPPPASEDAINSLQKRKVDREMLGSDGTAECSICMDNVELGQEVTVLPCNHWFHGECVISWLKEHDTCPHCRKSTSGGGRPRQPDSSRQRPSRRTSSYAHSLSATPDGNATHAILDANSPSSGGRFRQDGAENSREFDANHPGSPRHSSHRASSRRQSSRGSSGAEGSRGGSGGSPGGVTGWIRDHLPFS